MKHFLFLFFLLCTCHLSAEMKVLALTGSTRDDSLNKKLLQEAIDLARQRGAEVTVFNLKVNSMPLYDADLEAEYGMPPNAKYFKRLLIQSDLVMIASPEYNGSVSAVLKNAIDWASRKEKGGYSTVAFKGKHFFLLSASPGQGGGARGLKHLREILTNLGAIVEEEQITVPRADQQLGNKNAPYYKQLRQAIDRLIIDNGKYGQVGSLTKFYESLDSSVQQNCS